jgi:hypothetical protein
MRALPFCAGLSMLLAACSSGNNPTVTPATLTVTATPSSVVADGTNTITVHVAGPATGKVTLSTTQGTFDNGTSTTESTTVPFDATLHSCNASQTAGCTGTVTLRAVDAAGVAGAVSVQFTSNTGSLTIVATPTSATANGTSTVSIRVGGTASGNVTLTTTIGVFDNGNKTMTSATFPFTATLHSCDGAADTACIGAAAVRASDTGGNTASTSVTFTAPSSPVNPGTVSIGQITVTREFDVQGVRYSGFQEVNMLTFKVLDSAGNAYSAGLPVSFKHQSLGGSFIGATASCTTANPSECTASGVTDAQGLVAVPLVSGTAAGLVSVTAEATYSNFTVTTTAGHIAIIGAKANGAHAFIDCSPKSIPAFIDSHTCLTTFYQGDITCSAYFGDRFGNVLGVATLATFMSEAGAAGPPVSTAAYDPAQAAALGVATTTITVAGAPLPMDVPPIGGEPSLSVDNDACGSGVSLTRIRNPRDGLATVIVMARGEEGFTDLNGNGIHDDGEPFVDIGEPFVDANDDGQWNDGEPFVDLNGNLKHDGPNGVWDKDTTIWAETRIVYTGLPDFGPGLAGEPAMSYVTPSASSIIPTGTATVLLKARDENLNPLAPLVTKFAAAPETGIVSSAKVATTSGDKDRLGMLFSQQYCQEAPPAAAQTCSNVCMWSPCYVRTIIGAFGAYSFASVVVTAGSKAGGDLVDLPVTVDTTTIWGLYASITVETPTAPTPPATTGPLGQVSLLSKQYSVQGVRDSGFQEVNSLTFQVLDTSGNPFPAGQTVKFSHQSLGGSFIGASPTCTANNCTAAGVTDAGGRVTVQLVAGSVAGIVSVGASATASTVTVSTTAAGLAIVGAKASGAHIGVSCTPQNIPALIGPRDCLTTYYNKDVKCTAYFGDRFNNVLGVSLLATFMSEAGSAGPPVATIAFDPNSGSDQTTNLGHATNTISVTGGPLPQDVIPVGVEPFATVTSDPCGTGATSDRTHNPRDGLVTIIVMARGEEGFVDLNGNGRYDPPNPAASFLGEPFIDLGEPYIDADDNGQYDSGEQFVDLNGDGVYNGPNDMWDADTTIWAETRIMYTGLPSASASSANPASLVVPGTTTGYATFVFKDENLNALAPTFTSWTGAGALVSRKGLTTLGLTITPSTLDVLGLTFTQRYCKEKPGVAPVNCYSTCVYPTCYVRTTVGGYSAGSTGQLAVTGRGVSGSDTVEIDPAVDNTTLNVLTLPVTIP